MIKSHALLLRLRNIILRFRILQSQRILRFLNHPDKQQGWALDLVVEYDKNLLFHVDTSSFMEWHIFWTGFYEKAVSRLLKQVCKPGCVALDIGANVGMHALVMAHSVGAEGRVYAIEPHPELVKRLKANIAANRMSNLEVIEAALGESNGLSTLHSFGANFANKSASLYECNPILTDKIQVQRYSLDSLLSDKHLNRLDVIQIDTDGSDCAVIFGGRETIKKFRPVIFFEYEDSLWSQGGYSISAVNQFFAELNYTLYEMNNNCLSRIKQLELLKKNTNLIAFPD